MLDLCHLWLVTHTHTHACTHTGEGEPRHNSRTQMRGVWREIDVGLDVFDPFCSYLAKKTCQDGDAQHSEEMPPIAGEAAHRVHDREGEGRQHEQHEQL